MSQTTPTVDVFTKADEPKKLPEMLNVLTILTYIGSGLGLLYSIYSFLTIRSSYEQLLKMQDKMDEMPDLAKKMVGPHALENTQKVLENRVPILLLGLIGYALCIYGATQMRAFKKMGFTIYALGEIVLPIAGTMIILGTGVFAGFAMVIGLLFPLTFVILYATQLKHLS